MKPKKRLLTRLIPYALAALMLLGAAGCASVKTSGTLDPKHPVTVTLWNYYNGDPLAAFDKLVEEFNSTVGAEKGIVLVTLSQGDISTLADSLLDSVNGKAGAQDCPTLAAVYAETAYILDQADALEPLDAYFTEEELSAFVPGFLEEGRFNENNELLLFPILKSTELFTVNETDWAPFAADTGVTLQSIATKEDLASAAKAYYEWTDAQTPEVREDGKALYGRDSVANYIYAGAYQLGHELFKVENGALQVDMDRDTFRTLWDNYYIPYINGYFGAYAKFRSEDCKTGKILALTSSSSSIGYLPLAVTRADDTTYDISIYENKTLPFANAVNDAVVQQGASYCLLKSTPAQHEGAVEFLKWFTQADRNLDFALMSGYSPVTMAANTEEAITAAYSGDTSTAKGQNALKALLLCADIFSENFAYAAKPFSGSKDARSILEKSMQEKAGADREAVLAAIADGASREEAVAPFADDANFDAWFDDLCAQIDALTAQ